MRLAKSRVRCVDGGQHIFGDALLRIRNQILGGRIGHCNQLAAAGCHPFSINVIGINSRDYRLIPESEATDVPVCMAFSPSPKH